ncbi:MAG: methyltransferase domain-containing protein [Desulfobacterales bacterium]|nr:methyltransferase domain-containing protein [Desulfobacterales bacterium]
MKYYLLATHRRKKLDKLQDMYKKYYSGIVLDIGGRNRGKFVKPKDKVKKWIFADIEKKHNPDILLNVENMYLIDSQSVDIVNAIELLEHVKNPEKGLDEITRVLKEKGKLFLSMPFLYGIHADPYDFQRWTEYKLKSELKKRNFEILKFHIMGRMFTAMVDMIRQAVKRWPLPLRILAYLFYPLMDLLIKIDDIYKTNWHAGYFLIAEKKHVIQ